MSSHQPQYYSLPPPAGVDSVRLPSIKDLNFPPPGQEGAPSNGHGRAEHARSTRQEPAPWGRGPPSVPAPQHSQPHAPQHSPSMPPPHEPPPKSHQYAPSPKPDASYASVGPPPAQPPVGMPHRNTVGSGARSENPVDAPHKRRGPQQVGASPRPPHVSSSSPVKTSFNT